MDSNKKTDIVIKYNLQLKGTSKNRTNNSVAGMCDFSTSTLNLEQFKSYLLKNSGAVGNNARVSYIGEEKREIPIETEDDFRIALDYFRNMARSGYSINLKLDCISYKNQSQVFKRSISSPSELLNPLEKVIIKEKLHANTDSINIQPPLWFTEYMTKFKEDLIKEITSKLSFERAINPNSFTTTSTNTSQEDISVLKLTNKSKQKNKDEPVTSDVPLMSRKKINAHRKSSSNSFVPEKHVLKERKLDKKLAKLENRTLKIKAKKAKLHMKLGAVSNRPSKHVIHHNDPTDTFASEIEILMDAMPVKQQEATIPKMFGGQIYEQKWEVKNTGQLPWTSETELHYAWGSEALRPLNLNYSCPYLQPGEMGIVKVDFKIPRKVGIYESYWHFHHLGRRFGHWLGCQVIVEPSPIKDKKLFISSSASSIPFNDKINHPPLIKNLKSNIDDIKVSEILPTVREWKIEGNSYSENKKEIVSDFNFNKLLNKEMEELGNKVLDLTINKDKLLDGNFTSDSDNLSLASNASVVSSEALEEFVLIKKPVITIDQNLSDNNLNNNIETQSSCSNSTFVLEIPSDESDIDEYIKINKTLIPVPIIREKKQISNEGETNELEGGVLKNLVLKEAVNYFSEKDMHKEELENEQGETNELEGCFFKSLVRKEAVNDFSEKDTQMEEPKNEQESLTEIKDENCDKTYIEYEGKKYFVLKRLLRPDFLAEREAAKSVSDKNIKTVETKFVQEPSTVIKDELDNVRNAQSVYVSANATPEISLSCPIQEDYFNKREENKETNFMNNSEKNRLFVFPQSCPGFEVICSNSNLENIATSNSISSSLKESNQADCMAWISHYSSLGGSGFFHIPENNQQYQSYPTTIPHYPNEQFYPNQNKDLEQNQHNYGFSQPDFYAYGNLTNEDIKNENKETNRQEQQQELLPHISYTPEPQCSSGEGFLSNANSTVYDKNVPKTTKNEEMPTVDNLTDNSDCNKKESSWSNSNGKMQNQPFKKIFPENIVTGAASVASSAINTARSVFNMFNPEPGTWVNGHWVPRDTDLRREKNLNILKEMGFYNRDYNATLLARFNDDISQVISELIQ